MYRQFLAHVPCKSSTRIFPSVLINYCHVSKCRKKKGTKPDSSEDSKLPDSEAILLDNSPDMKKQENCGKIQKSSLLVGKASSKKKQQMKPDTLDDVTKSTKEKTSRKSISAKAETSEPEKLSLLERYGDSISMPGMKPLSVAKKKKTDQLEAQQASTNTNTTDIISKGTIEKTKKDTSALIESIYSTELPSIEDLTKVIPRLRSPSFRMEKTLDVPHEWASMSSSWTPSQEFLDNILKFPIRGLDKQTNFEWKDTEHVSCFVTANKNAVKVVPAVTTVLSKTMSSAQAFALKLWRERLTVQLGEEGFLEHKSQILLRGKLFHDTIQRYLQGESVQSLGIESQPLIAGCWKSLVPVLNRIDDVIAVESEVLHPRLLYRGIIDCIVEIKNQPFIVEWKHSSRKKRSLQQNYDSPVQLMAYTGAINSNASYPFGVKNSLLVVAYDDGSPADVFLLSAVENGDVHWNTWLKRLHAYWSLHKADKDLGN